MHDSNSIERVKETSPRHTYRRVDDKDKEEMVFIASNKMVLMQIAKADVRNIDNSSKQSTQVLFFNPVLRAHMYHTV